MLTLLVALTAAAQAVQVRFCFSYNVYIEDAEDVGDDFINNNATNLPARGAFVRVKVNGGSTIWAGHLFDAGANVGCTPQLNNLVNLQDHTISLRSEMAVRGEELFLYDAPGGMQSLYVAYPSTTYQPPLVDETRNFVLSTQDHWSNMAIAAWTVWHADTGTMDDINMFMSSCASGVDGTCCAPNAVSGRGELFLNGYARKALLAHFLGHCVWTAAGGPHMSADYATLYDGDIPPCDYATTLPHTILTREFQASNVWEGWASFYWANAFNDGAEWVDGDGECSINHYLPDELDWDTDDTVSMTEDDPLVSCAGSTNVEDESDYYWEWCSGDPTPLDGIDDDVNMGTELDWARQFWDFAWIEDPVALGADDVLALILASDPDGWNIDGHATGAGNPYDEIVDAVDAGPAEWDTWYTVNYNGIEQ